MATVEITLPDDLAQQAADAGLLAPEAIEHLLREALRRHGSGPVSQQQPWRRHPAELITPPAGDDSSAAAREVQAELKRREATGGPAPD